MATQSEQISGLLGAIPLVTLGVLVVLLILGVILWLMGRRLARPACAASGLVLGGLGGIAVGHHLAGQGAMVLPLTIGAAIAGALLAALLFRVWMGLSAAVLLALVVPAACVVWMGTVPLPGGPGVSGGDGAAAPDDSQPIAAQTQPATLGTFIDQVKEVLEPLTAGSDESAESALDADVAQTMANGLLAQFQELYDQQAQQVSAWWEQLDPSTRTTIYLAGAIGAILGLIFGLLGPYIAASFESALVGSMLILFAGRALFQQLLPQQADWLPQSPRGCLIALGLITILGCLIQWTAFAKRADK